MTCSKFVHPQEVVRTGESVIRCWDCYNKSNQVLESFSDPPAECALCHISFEVLAARRPGQSVSMFPHWMDGTYGFLCPECDKAYVLKRRDLYGLTRFGWERKIQ
jgi:hypothetical protein